MGTLPEVSDIFPDISEVSDAKTAQAILQKIWPVGKGRPAKTSIELIYAALQRIERSLPKEVMRHRPRQWTERRVRGIWDGEARRIEAYEMKDLKRAAVEAAQHEHQEAIQRAERLATFISAYRKDDSRQAA